ncbi:MAG TPA: hypothetical protein VIB79_01420 [Candidatus Binatia bacterium]
MNISRKPIVEPAGRIPILLHGRRVNSVQNQEGETRIIVAIDFIAFRETISASFRRKVEESWIHAHSLGAIGRIAALDALTHIQFFKKRKAQAKST